MSRQQIRRGLGRKPANSSAKPLRLTLSHPVTLFTAGYRDGAKPSDVAPVYPSQGPS